MLNKKRTTNLWSTLKSLFTIDDYYMDETFSLGNRTNKGEPEVGTEAPTDQDKKTNKGEKKNKKGFIQPKKPEEFKQVPADSESSEFNPNKMELEPDLDTNLAWLKKGFSMPPNMDLIIREFLIPLDTPVRCAALFLEGMSDRNTIDKLLLMPMMEMINLVPKGWSGSAVEFLEKQVLPINQVQEQRKLGDIIVSILSGNAAVLIDGYPTSLILETKGWEHRSVGRPQSENVIRGPQEAFTEHIRVNTALVRRRLKTDLLVTEMVKVGRLSNTDIAIMYLNGITNPKLVKEVKRRIKAIKIDYLADSGTLEEMIEDNPFSIFPGQLATERPDRVAAGLVEGQVGIIVDGDPFGLVVPTTFWTLLHTAEDYYIRWPYGFLLRFIRSLALFITLMVPAFYIAITSYHPEMIPTDLLMSIAASREHVPFPVIAEVLFMEVSFELIREAGVRIPTLIGPTIGIVGALILGQAAVAASIISPTLVIVVAVTGLASFTIPNYSLSLGVRSLRFVFIILAGTLGFYGLAIIVFIVAVHTCGQKTFGMPYVSPVAPYRPGNADVIYYSPSWLQERRPSFTRPQNFQRQEEYVRTWDPAVGQQKDKAEQKEPDVNQ